MVRNVTCLHNKMYHARLSSVLLLATFVVRIAN